MRSIFGQFSAFYAQFVFYGPIKPFICDMFYKYLICYKELLNIFLLIMYLIKNKETKRLPRKIMKRVNVKKVN